MGTNFDCPFEVNAQPSTGLVWINLGPVQAGNLKELIDWLASDEGRDRLIHNVARALMGENDA